MPTGIRVKRMDGREERHLNDCLFFFLVVIRDGLGEGEMRGKEKID